MPEDNQQYCPRCSGQLTCKRNSIADCDCNTVLLSAPTRSFLQSTFYHCLCTDCLKEIERLVHYAQTNPFLYGSDELKEGIHYYIDNGMFVFTERYHVQKGYCCKNKCRHCAYGFGLLENEK